MDVNEFGEKWGEKMGISGVMERREASSECPGMMLAILVVNDELTGDLKDSLQDYLDRDELSVMTQETARGFIDDLGDGADPPFIAIVSPGTRQVLNRIKFREA